MKPREWFETFDEELWLGGDENAADQAAFLKKALRLRKDQTVLDAPCGAGRIAVHLARAGLLVLGIDRNPYFLERARQRFLEEGLEGEFLEADLREVGLVGGVHGALNWGGSFGSFDDAGNGEVLARLARAVRPGGRVLVDQPNREHVLRHFADEMDRGSVRIRNRWNARTERIDATWTLVRHGAEHTYRTSMRLYTPAQLKRLMTAAGLDVEAAYGSAGGEPFTRTAQRLILVGRRPA